MQWIIYYQFLFLLQLVISSIMGDENCWRKLYEAKEEKTPGSSGFVIEISSATNTSDINSDGYTPGDSYIGNF